MNIEYDKKSIREYWTELSFNYLHKYRLFFWSFEVTCRKNINNTQIHNECERTFQTLYLSGQPILKINKQNQAIYTIQQPIKIHLRSP